jgi:hypothetical protein
MRVFPILCAGNHDMVYYTTDLTGTNYDIYFPYTDFTEYDWYGGHFPDTCNANSYQLFSAWGLISSSLIWFVNLRC